MKIDFFAGKTVLVMGLGRFGGGIDAADFASKLAREVIVTDKDDEAHLSGSVSRLAGRDNIKFHLGGHQEGDFAKADIVVVNPAVPEDNKFVKIAVEHGRFVTTAMNIFFELCPADIVGITGSNGKSTTTALTYHLLKNAKGQAGFNYRNVYLSGNIGNEPLLALLDNVGPDDLVVLEISSFQSQLLANINKAPRYSLVTNLTPNHLDRHGTFEAYCDAKENLFRLQKCDAGKKAYSFFNAEDKVTMLWFEKYRKQTGRVCAAFDSNNVSVEMKKVYPLPGRANLSNLAAASSVAKAAGVTDQNIINSLGSFKSLPHRLELVAEKKGVRWYNDSISTTPQSSIVALEAFEEPKIIIAGGYDKKLPFNEFTEKIAKSAKAVVVIGNTADTIAKQVKQFENSSVIVKKASSLQEAVNLCEQLADSGDVVLLSPACASYDMFINFEDRGNQFANLVRQLKD
ncbi:MAG TPA: UDP-N-acetylmuramoyl-L-alanine--D-glutamate ligase [Sedimentisphaerales bacterium]|nr:UDP-N-acetylmuramoyl-L-alanine--D-glutamate ligase [Sedimentisphaerales bacterium]